MMSVSLQHKVHLWKKALDFLAVTQRHIAIIRVKDSLEVAAHIITDPPRCVTAGSRRWTNTGQTGICFFVSQNELAQVFKLNPFRWTLLAQTVSQSWSENSLECFGTILSSSSPRLRSICLSLKVTFKLFSYSKSSEAVRNVILSWCQPHKFSVHFSRVLRDTLNNNALLVTDMTF